MHMMNMKKVKLEVNLENIKKIKLVLKKYANNQNLLQSIKNIESNEMVQIPSFTGSTGPVGTGTVQVV